MTTLRLGLGILALGAGAYATRVRPRDTVVLLDLNGVLVDRVWAPINPDPKAFLRTGKKDVHLRPETRDFLDRLGQEWGGVGVWTAGRGRNVWPITDALGIWRARVRTQEQCDAVEREGTFPLYVKDLRAVEGAMGARHAILVDDSLDKVRVRDWWRAVIVEPWSHADGGGTPFEDVERRLRAHPVRKFARNCMLKLIS